MRLGNYAGVKIRTRRLRSFSADPHYTLTDGSQIGRLQHLLCFLADHRASLLMICVTIQLSNSKYIVTGTMLY